MSVYLDASVIVPLLVREDSTDAVLAFIDALPEPPWLSDFAAGEVASVLSRLVRMGRLREAGAQRSLTAFDGWATSAQPLTIDSADVQTAALHVRQFALGLRMPDALHLAMAQRRGLRLATLDRRLHSAASSLNVDAVML